MTDGELQRIRESLKSDATDLVRSPVAKAWVTQVRLDLENLLDLVEADHAKQGGTFAVALRNALEARILAKVADRVALTNDTTEKSLSVHVTPLGVFVDVRLQVGVWKQ